MTPAAGHDRTGPLFHDDFRAGVLDRSKWNVRTTGRVVNDELQAYIRDRLLPEMHAVDPQTGFDFEPLSRIAGLSVDEDAEIVQLAKALTGANSTGKVAFGTEAGLFQEMAGIPTVVCGPGDIEQAHKPDEFIDLDQVAQCEVFIRRLFERCRG